MDTGAADCAKVSNSTNKVLIITRLTMPVAVSLLLMGCDTLQTDSPSRANAFPSKSTAYARASAPPSPAVSDDADTSTNEVQSVVPITPKKPTPPTPQPAPVVVQQQSRPAVVPVASAAPVKASEKPVSPKAPVPADKSAPKVAKTAPVPSAPQPATAQTASASASPVEALIVKGPPRPAKRPSQGLGKVVWFGLAAFGVAVLLLGTRVSVDNPRPAKVSVGRRKKKSKVVDEDVVLPPELEMREPTGL